MTLVHKCNNCRTCFKCFAHNCTTNLPPNEIKESLENGWHIKRCYNCNEIIEKFESLESLQKKREANAR